MSKDNRESLRRKRCARLAAVQAIYSYQVSERKPKADKLKDTILLQWKDSVGGRDDEWPSDDMPETSLFNTLTDGVIEELAALDACLAYVIKEEWKAERMDPVMLAILRCAAFEMNHYQQRNSAVIVDEYMAVANGFFDDNELAYVNSALHQLVHHVRHADE